VGTGGLISARTTEKAEAEAVEEEKACAKEEEK
jgi:hypothetical protein